mmetsp:Transcript_1765/g.4108  ORF Transcript_1765/g.4108 Transcript_1765/m.4108 type:complete len:197 (-) Transcript_1765:134-724(-)
MAHTASAILPASEPRGPLGINTLAAGGSQDPTSISTDLFSVKGAPSTRSPRGPARSPLAQQSGAHYKRSDSKDQADFAMLSMSPSSSPNVSPRHYDKDVGTFSVGKGGALVTVVLTKNDSYGARGKLESSIEPASEVCAILKVSGDLTDNKIFGESEPGGARAPPDSFPTGSPSPRPPRVAKLRPTPPTEQPPPMV